MVDSQPSLRLCLLLGTETIPHWFMRALEIATKEDNITVSLIIQADQPDGGGDVDLVADIRQKKSWTLVAALQKLSDIVFEPPAYDVGYSIENLPFLEDVPVRRTTVETSGEYGYEFSDTDVGVLQQEADVGVHFGIGILRGRVLEAPKWGVVGFHHGDIRDYRGGPPGFWEFVHGSSKTGVTVQRFTETLDGGEILALEEVPIDDASTWREVRERQGTVAEQMLAQAIENLCDPGFKPESPDKLGPVYSTGQRNWQVTARYIYREFLGRSRSILDM